MAIYVVIGTKAQLIKMAPVLKEMEKRGIQYINLTNVIIFSLGLISEQIAQLRHDRSGRL